jgi:transposase
VFTPYDYVERVGGAGARRAGRRGRSGNTAIAAKLGIAVSSARKWRSRFVRDRLDGMLDEPWPGRPGTVTDAQVERVIDRTLETAPRDATHWSTRGMAADLGLSQSAVSRIWRAFGLQPHRQDAGKLSKDPLFIDKVRDVVGLCLDPSQRAVVPRSHRPGAAECTWCWPTPPPTRPR